MPGALPRDPIASIGPQKRLCTELHPDTFHGGPSPRAVAAGCGGGMEEGGRGAGAKRCQGPPEPGGGQALQAPCPKWARGQPHRGQGCWPGLAGAAYSPSCQDRGLSGSQSFCPFATCRWRAGVRFLWLPAPKHPGLGDLPA